MDTRARRNVDAITRSASSLLLCGPIIEHDKCNTALGPTLVFCFIRPTFKWHNTSTTLASHLPCLSPRHVCAQCMSLSALGLIGGEKVILETKAPDGTWPRRNFIEQPNFRQFRENDRVDAMDYQGRWFRGQVQSLLSCRWRSRLLVFVMEVEYNAAVAPAVLVS